MRVCFMVALVLGVSAAPDTTFGPSAITATFEGKRVPRRHGPTRAVTWATFL